MHNVSSVLIVLSFVRRAEEIEATRRLYYDADTRAKVAAFLARSVK